MPAKASPPDLLLKQIYQSLEQLSEDISGKDGSGGLRAEVSKVKSEGKTNRKWVVLSIVGVTLDMLLSVGFFVVVDKLGDQSDATTVACRSANELGRSQKTLWAPILVGPKQKGETDAEYQKKLDKVIVPPRNAIETDQQYNDRIKFRDTIVELAKPREC